MKAIANDTDRGSTMGHFYNLADIGIEETVALLADAARYKRQPVSDELEGRQFVLWFQNPSLRTRCSFEVALRQMGAGVSTLEPGMIYGLETRDGTRMDGEEAEHVREAVGVLSRFYSGIGLRTLARGTSFDDDIGDALFTAFMRHAGVPVFNMESAMYHPCQALADLMTIRELLGGHAGRRITITWAPHPRPLPMAVTNSLLLAAASMGMEVTLAHPRGFELADGVIDRAHELARRASGTVRISNDQESAARGAAIVYAKSWGALSRYDAPEEERNLCGRHADWIVDEALMSQTANAHFMHCLPVRRNVVVTDAVLDSSCSAVLENAENRLHVQKAVLSRLYSGDPTRNFSSPRDG